MAESQLFDIDGRVGRSCQSLFVDAPLTCRYDDPMAASADGVTIYHNPNCNSSLNAVRIAEELGVDADIVLYLKTPPDAATLRSIIAKLEDPVTDLVRRDNLWAKLGLTDDDAATRRSGGRPAWCNTSSCCSGRCWSPAIGRSSAVRRTGCASC